MVTKFFEAIDLDNEKRCENAFCHRSFVYCQLGKLEAVSYFIVVKVTVS